MSSPLHLFAFAFGCFLAGHLVVLGAFVVARAPTRVRFDPKGLRYLVEFVGAEALMLTAVLSLGVVRLSAFSTSRTAVTLAVGLVWWEVWFYAGHRLLHTRALYRFHRPHHASTGLHPSLCFGAVETVVLSSGFYVPLALASHLFGAVSVETLVFVFAGAYALNVVSHLDAPAGGRWRRVLSSARHALHHAGRRGNYGLNSPWLDRLCGTEV